MADASPADDAPMPWSAYLCDPGAGLARAHDLVAADPGDDLLGGWARLTLGYDGVLFGAPPGDARARLTSAMTAFAQRDEVRGEMLARAALVRLDVLEGGAGHAPGDLLTLHARAMEQLEPIHRFWVLEALSVACIARDRIDQALGFVREAQDAVCAPGSRAPPTMLSLLAAAHLAIGQHQRASELARSAAAALAGSAHPFALHARTTLADALLRDGDAARARAIVDTFPTQSAGRATALEIRAWSVAAQVHAQLDDFRHAYDWQRRASDALSSQLARREHIEHELTKALEVANAQRERAENDGLQSAALNRRLEHLNAELTQRMHEIEALQARLTSQAVRDSLTELYNRRHLDLTVPALLASATRRGSPLSLALLDLDHFKRINDRHGHPAGDRVLAAIGRLFGRALRPADLVCRYGGEEFCVVFPDTTADGAKRALQHLAEHLRMLTVETASGAKIGKFTFSAGVAEHPVHGRTAADLIAGADRALYAAKHSGRNRILIQRSTERRTG